MNVAVAVLAFGDIAVARGGGLGVDAVIVSGLLVGVAGGANGLGRRALMRNTLDVGVAIGATEGTMDRRLEFGVIYMEADLLAVLVFRETGIIMASQTVVIAQLGGGFRRRAQ